MADPRIQQQDGVTFAKVGLIALMSLGSLLMWVAVPILWLWIGSRLSTTTQGKIGPYVVVIIGIPVSMAVIAKVLGVLNRTYARMAGTEPTGRITRPWLRSLRGERGESHPRTVLDTVMIATVATAVVALAIWFFFFAGSSLPTG